MMELRTSYQEENHEEQTGRSIHSPPVVTLTYGALLRCSLSHCGRCGALADLSFVLTGSYNDDEPGALWSVVRYVDARCRPEQQQALTNIFLGRAGGATLRNFARAIEEVYAARPTQILLDHAPDQEHIAVECYVKARTTRPVLSDTPVSCGIPGHDRPGQEIIAEAIQVGDGAFHWSIAGQCGCATSFAFSPDESYSVHLHCRRSDSSCAQRGWPASTRAWSPDATGVIGEFLSVPGMGAPLLLGRLEAYVVHFVGGLKRPTEKGET